MRAEPGSVLQPSGAEVGDGVPDGAFSASSSIFSPSWTSMARLTLPSRLELKRRGVLRGALGEVSFTASCGSPVRISRRETAPGPHFLLDHVGVCL